MAEPNTAVASPPRGFPIRPEHLAARVAAVVQKTGASAVGVHATGLWTGGDHVEVGGKQHPVVVCTSVLAVREALDRHAAHQESDGSAPALVLLTPLSTEELGWDVRVRLARRRLLETAPWDLVSDLFRARTVDPRISAHGWMARLLLDHTPAGGYPPVPNAVLDADTAWMHVFDQALGPRVKYPDADALLADSLAARLSDRFERLPDEARAAAAGRIRDTAGPLGELLVAAVEAGHGAMLIPLGLTCDVLFPEDGGRGRELDQAAVRLEPFLEGRTVAPELGRRWAEAAQRVLDRLSEAELASVYQRTEDLLREVRADAFVGLSRVLPAGYGRRLEAFGRAITAFVSAEAGVASVEEAFARVAQHRQARQGDEPRRIERLRMALRLVRFLESRRQTTPAETRSLAEGATRYMSGSSFVDWARTLLLGGEQSAQLDEALGALSERVRAVRERENQAFATKLAAWNEAPAAMEGVLPVEHVLEGVVAPAARQAPVLLLVLDGMGFASFRQLHEQLRQQGWAEWAPSDQQHRALALAVSPCITRLSRTSLFSGRLTTGTSHDEKKAFARHPGLVSDSQSKKPPVLFHKGDLAEGTASGLAEAVRETLQEEKQRVVGIVLNVLDDALAASDQVLPRWTLDHIRLLQPILFEARLAGRVVVLTSDHGHVLEAEGKTLPGGTDERWRAFGEPIAPEEVVLVGPRIEAAVGTDRIVVPWSERVRYTRKKAGYHGGATPQEMLMPVAVMASGDQRFEDWKLLTETPPAWWKPEREETPPSSTEDRPSEASPSSRRPAPRSPRSPSTGVQPSLFEEPPEPAEPEPPEPERSSPAEAALPGGPDWIEKLLSSEAYAAQRSMAGRMAPADETVRTCLTLAERNHGRVSRAALSGALGLPEVRLRGFLAGLQRLLNLDGYPVVSVDEASDTIEVNRDLLRRQFQINPQ